MLGHDEIRRMLAERAEPLLGWEWVTRHLLAELERTEAEVEAWRASAQEWRVRYEQLTLEQLDWMRQRDDMDAMRRAEIESLRRRLGAGRRRRRRGRDGEPS